MAINIFVKLTYLGNDYFLSNSAVTADKVYYPYLITVPSIGVGGEGYAKVTTGSLSLILSDDPTHPFSGDRYYSLINNPQKIAFSLSYEDEQAPLFQGSLTLSEVTESELRFLVIEEDFEKKLVYPVINKDSSRKIDFFYLYKPTGVEEYRLMLACPEFIFYAQDEIIIERMYSYYDQQYLVDPFMNLIYSPDKENRYLVANDNSKRGLLVDIEDNTKYITIQDLLNVEITGDSAVYYPTDTALYQAMGVDFGAPLGLTYQELDENGDDILGSSVPYNDLMIFDSNGNAEGELFKINTPPENEYRLGSPVANPFSFGGIEMRDPVVVFGDRKIKKQFTNYDGTTQESTPISASAQVNHKSNFAIFDRVDPIPEVPAANVYVDSTNASQFNPKYVPQGTIQNGTYSFQGYYAWVREDDHNTLYWSRSMNPTSSASGGQRLHSRTVSAGNSYSGPVYTSGNLNNFNPPYTSAGYAFRDNRSGVSNTTTYNVYTQGGALYYESGGVLYSRSGGGGGGNANEYPTTQPSTLFNQGGGTQWNGMYNWTFQRTYTQHPYTGYGHGHGSTDTYWYVNMYSGLIYIYKNGSPVNGGSFSGNSTHTWNTSTIVYNGSVFLRGAHQVVSGLNSNVRVYQLWEMHPGNAANLLIYWDGNIVYNTARDSGTGTDPVVTWDTTQVQVGSYTYHRQNPKFKTEFDGNWWQSSGSSETAHYYDLYRSSYSPPQDFYYSIRYDSYTESDTYNYNPFRDTTQRVEGVTGVAEYDYQQSRKYIYNRDGQSVPHSAWGNNWANNRRFDQSDHGYYLSQIIIDGGLITESDERIKISTSGSFVNGLKDIPQEVKVTDLQRAAGINSEIFRIYRGDSLDGIGQDMGFFKIKDPQAFSHASFTKQSGGAFGSATDRGELIFSLSNIHLDYDDTSSAYINLNCYCGCSISNLYFMDSSGAVLEETNPDGTEGGFRETFQQYPLPIGTQQLMFKTAYGSRIMDTYSYQNMGFDFSIHQRILPVIGDNGSFESNRYATAWMGQAFEANHSSIFKASTEFAEVYNILDVQQGLVSGEEYGGVSDEKNVYSIRNPNLIPTSVDKFGNRTLRVFDDGVELGVDSDQIYYEASDLNFIHLSVDPFGQIAISGDSFYGKTIFDFFNNLVCHELNEEDPLISLNADVSLAPNAATMELPVYQDSEITVLEMATKIATATNHIFHFEYVYDDATDSIKRNLILIDVNAAFAREEYDFIIRESEIVEISTDYPYPIKAFESTLTKNERYSATQSSNRESIMKSLSFKYRIAGSGIGNVKNYDLFAQSFSGGKSWLRRFSETDPFPSVTLIYQGIDRGAALGSRVRFTDYLRKIIVDMVIMEMAYDFNNETTMIKGLAKFSEIVYR